MLKINNRQHLEYTILKEMRINGKACNLNHLDISNITDLSYLFCPPEKAIPMHAYNIVRVDSLDYNTAITISTYIFKNDLSEFCGDISDWNTSNVNSMTGIFYKSSFRNDISKWIINENCSIENALSEFNFSPLGIMCAIKKEVEIEHKHKNFNKWLSLAASLNLSLNETARIIYDQLISSKKVKDISIPDSLFENTI